MLFNTAYHISLQCTFLSNKVTLYSDSIFQALSLDQITYDIFEDIFIAVLKINKYDSSFLHTLETNAAYLLCFALV